MKVKICGITSAKDVEIASKYADALGFVVEYPEDVPWNLDRDKAAELIKKTPSTVSTVVITTGVEQKIIEILESTVPDAIQLHGKETLNEVKNIVEYCKGRGINTIKAVPIGFKKGTSYGKNPIEVGRKFVKIGVEGILFDSKSTGEAGGTGKTINWNILEEAKKEIDTMIILAGGLNSTNLREACSIVKPDFVDVITGIETNGEKDEEKIKEIYKIAKRC